MYAINNQSNKSKQETNLRTNQYSYLYYISQLFMVKSLGDHNKEKSSTADFKNIKWTAKNLPNTKKPKNPNKRKISPSNILPSNNKEKAKKPQDMVYKIEEDSDNKKQKNQIIVKKFQKSSASNSLIKQGFKRPGR